MRDLIRADGICKEYKDFALRDVSFHVAAGTITGFIGRNGAGKTTTMRILLGLSPYTRGRISFFGADRSGADPAVRARIGVVLDGGFFDDLTAAQMKQIIASAYPNWSDTDYQRAMDMFSLDQRRKLKTYSRGMRAKYALALALSHRAELLIMDEPTSGLDPLIRRELLEVLRDFMNGGERAVVFSTHITSDLDRIADDVILMDQGKIIFQKDRDQLLEEHRLVRGTHAQLTPEVRNLLSDVHKTPFGFAAVTAYPEMLRQSVPGIILERPTVEDIMAAYVNPESEQGGSRNARTAL